MEEIKVGILASKLVFSGKVWADEEQGIDYLEIAVGEISDFFLKSSQPKTTFEFYSFNGSIGSYTLVARLKDFYLFARGDLSKVFTS